MRLLPWQVSAKPDGSVRVQIAQHPVLYCKSWRGDLQRAKRLALSISRFNEDSLPFYLSAPESDLDDFRSALQGLPVTLLSDEEILASNPSIDTAEFAAMPTYWSQQVVKSEFWRMGHGDPTICIDSDSYFIRPFGHADFLRSDGIPYTIIHQGKDYFQFLINIGRRNAVDATYTRREKLSDFFTMSDVIYSFAPTPAIWSSSVWKALDEQVLKPREMTIVDAIRQCPAELDWYGNTMLNFLPIPLIPREPLFRVYHYPELFWRYRRQGETEEKLKEQFLGVIQQSFWDTELEPRFSERLRRSLKYSKRYFFGRW